MSTDLLYSESIQLQSLPAMPQFSLSIYNGADSRYITVTHINSPDKIIYPVRSTHAFGTYEEFINACNTYNFLKKSLSQSIEMTDTPPDVILGMMVNSEKNNVIAHYITGPTTTTCEVSISNTGFTSSLNNSDVFASSSFMEAFVLISSL